MDYYQRKAKFKSEIKDLIEAQAGKKVPIAVIELNIADRYGFGKSMILKELTKFEALNMVEISENHVIISKK